MENYFPSRGVLINPEKRNIALSFQDNCLFPHKNVLQNILFKLLLRIERISIFASRVTRFV